MRNALTEIHLRP